MILLATFVSVSMASGMSSGSSQVPSIEVQQIKVPSQTTTGGGFGAYSPENTKILCERMGQTYKLSLLATLPNSTTVVMTCVKDSLSEYAS